MKADLNRYEDPWTAEVYDFQITREADTALWLALAQESGGPVLELACGTGRVLLLLARAGFHVTGLDVSPYMLAVARRKIEKEPPQVQARVRLVEGDMRDFIICGAGVPKPAAGAPMHRGALQDRFGLILITFHSFQALLERSDQRRCLRSCAAHLAPGGRLAIDVFNPRPSRISAPAGLDEAVREYLGPDGVVVRQSGHTDYDLANQRLVWRVRYECTAADGHACPPNAGELREHLLELRYFFRFEMEWMLEACGFEVEALYGNFERSPFAADSPEMIFVARRADDVPV
jgi:SAM-dependent methyltransferase